MCIVKAVNDRGENWEWGGQIIEDIRGMLSNKPHWLITHTYRETNKTSDFLAKYALNIDEDLVWMEEGPEGLYNLILQDKVVIDTS